MASKEHNLSALYAELNKLERNGEYERALKTTNRSEILHFSLPYENCNCSASIATELNQQYFSLLQSGSQNTRFILSDVNFNNRKVLIKKN